jgi:HK97 family phage major capsid protein
MSDTGRTKFLRARRAALKTELDSILAAPTAEKRGLTDAEDARFASVREEIREIDRNLEESEEADRRAARVDRLAVELGQTGEQRNPAEHVSRWHVGAGGEVYRRGGQHSYFRDLALSRLAPDAGVHERLMRHASETDRALASGDIEARWAGPVEQRTNPNRTDGTGGYFVPPAWLISEYVGYARPARAVADLCNRQDLPPGTDTINIPKIATPTATGVQTADAAAVTSTDMTDTFVSSPVITIAGQQDCSMQLLEQSPASFDQIVFSDLQADYNQRLDLQVLSGTGSGGQVTGILNVAGINSVTYTDASPTMVELWPSLPQAASLVARNVFGSPTAAAMTPSRWFWSQSQLDASNRPFIVGAAQGPQNSMGSLDATAAQGVVGNLGGLPVVRECSGEPGRGLE